MPVRVSARAIIICNGAILLSEFVDETGLHYNLPGGGVEDGESVRDAVRREVREETALDVTVGDLLFALEYEPVRNQGWGGQRHHLSLVFACSPVPGSLARLPDSPDANQTGVKWVPLNEIEKVELLPHIYEKLRNYLKDGGFSPLFMEEPVMPERAERYLRG